MFLFELSRLTKLGHLLNDETFRGIFREKPTKTFRVIKFLNSVNNVTELQPLISQMEIKKKTIKC